MNKMITAGFLDPNLEQAKIEAEEIS